MSFLLPELPPVILPALAGLEDLLDRIIGLWNWFLGMTGLQSAMQQLGSALSNIISTVTPADATGIISLFQTMTAVMFSMMFMMFFFTMFSSMLAFI